MTVPNDDRVPISSKTIPNLEALQEFITACVALRLPFTVHLEAYEMQGGKAFPRFIGLIYAAKETS